MLAVSFIWIKKLILTGRGGGGSDIGLRTFLFYCLSSKLVVAIISAPPRSRIVVRMNVFLFAPPHCSKGRMLLPLIPLLVSASFQNPFWNTSEAFDL